MRKLLSAGFQRLWKDRYFWWMLAFVGIFSLANILNSARSCIAMAEQGYIHTLDDYYFNQAPIMGGIFGLFVSVFLGTEYGDGVIRNKLVIGHKREHIYIGHFLVCCAASLLLSAVWLLVEGVGFFLIGPMEMGMADFFVYVVMTCSITVSFTAVYTLLGSLFSNKAMAVVYTIFCVFLLAIASSGFYD